jgi:hypothetical protein
MTHTLVHFGSAPGTTYEPVPEPTTTEQEPTA